jgi:hypothetical protein
MNALPFPLPSLDEATLASFAVFELAVAIVWAAVTLIERWRRRHAS